MREDFTTAARPRDKKKILKDLCKTQKARLEASRANPKELNPEERIKKEAAQLTNRATKAKKSIEKD